MFRYISAEFCKVNHMVSNYATRVILKRDHIVVIDVGTNFPLSRIFFHNNTVSSIEVLPVPYFNKNAYSATPSGDIKLQYKVEQGKLNIFSQLKPLVIIETALTRVNGQDIYVVVIYLDGYIQIKYVIKEKEYFRETNYMDVRIQKALVNITNLISLTQK